MLSLFQDDRIIAVIDTETTGINSNKDRIVQFSGKKYRIRDQKMEQIAEMDIDRKSTRLNSSHMPKSRMPSSA